LCLVPSCMCHSKNHCKRLMGRPKKGNLSFGGGALNDLLLVATTSPTNYQVEDAL
jgi:hypothetical protein